MKKKTLVFGASTNPRRYAYLAMTRLVDNGHDVVAFGLKTGKISGVDIDIELIPYRDLNTITLYMNPGHQKAYYQYLIGLQPKRIIFNPGTENPEFYQLLRAQNIPYEQACTLVLLSINQY